MIIGNTLLSELVKCLGKLDNAILFICQTEDGKLDIHTVEGDVSLSYLSENSYPLEGINVGVNAEKFQSVCKKFVSNIELSLNKTLLKVVSDNVTVTMPTVQSIPSNVDRNKYYSVGSELLGSLAKCYASIGKDHIFSGILLDNSFDDCTKVACFSHGVVRSITHKKLFSGPDHRFVIPMKFAEIVSGLGSVISGFLISERKIIAVTKSGVKIAVSMCYDDCPTDWNNTFNFDKNKYFGNHIFSSLDLFCSIDVSSSIMDKAEQFLEMACVGMSGEYPVWTVSASSSSGHKVEEKIKSAEKSDIIDSRFKFSRKNLVGVLKSFDGEQVSLFDSHDVPVLIKDVHNDGDLAFMVKMHV